MQTTDVFLSLIKVGALRALLIKVLTLNTPDFADNKAETSQLIAPPFLSLLLLRQD